MWWEERNVPLGRFSSTELQLLSGETVKKVCQTGKGIDIGIIGVRS